MNHDQKYLRTIILLNKDEYDDADDDDNGDNADDDDGDDDVTDRGK